MLLQRDSFRLTDLDGAEVSLKSPFFIASFIKDLETGHPHDFMT